jgi:hypothetical protein
VLRGSPANGSGRSRWMHSHVIVETITTTPATESSRRNTNFANEPPMPAEQPNTVRNPHVRAPVG